MLSEFQIKLNKTNLCKVSGTSNINQKKFALGFIS